MGRREESVMLMQIELADGSKIKPYAYIPSGNLNTHSFIIFDFVAFHGAYYIVQIHPC